MAIARAPCDEGVVRAAPETLPCDRRTGVWVLVATIGGSSMAFIDGSVVNVALPVLQADLHATVAGVQWVIEIYSLFLSALILVGGSLGDEFGRKRIFGLGIALFTLASIGCGLSQNISELIAARAIQGIGGALLVPGSLALISASFNEEQRGRAIGTWSGFSAITAGFAPLLGGLLIQYLSWRAIFFINVPFACIVLTVLATRVPDSRNQEASRLDWPGAALATVGLGGLAFGLIQSTVLGLGDPVVLAALAAGVAGLVLFVVVEARSSMPMMPLGLFRSRTFSGANLLTLLLYGALGEVMFFLPFNLIRVHGYSPTEAGAAFIPFIVIMFALSRWSGGLTARFGGKFPLVVGPIVAGIGMTLFARPGIGGSYWATFFPAVVVLGLGMAIAVAPLTTVVMSAVSQQNAGIASGINNAASRTAGLLSIAAFGIVAVQIFANSLDRRLTTLRVSHQVQSALDSQRAALTNVQLPASASGALRIALQHAIGQAFVDAFRVAVLAGAALAVVSALIAAIMIQGKKPETVQQEAPATPHRRPAAEVGGTG